MPRTEQQQIIVEKSDSKEIKSLGVKALAGTGKSFLLKEIVKEYPEKNFLGLAFNGSIASSNSKSFPDKNSYWNTVHGLARNFFEKQNIPLGNIKSEIKPIELIDSIGIKNNDFELASLVLRMHEIFSNSSVKNITVDDIVKASKAQRRYIELAPYHSWFEDAVKHLETYWNMQIKGKIPATHDFYLKFFELKGFAKTIKNFDVKLIDEAQDSNAVTMSIVNQISGNNIYVGDSHQSIYNFRGALDAMKFADENYPLSKTFRYIQDIADRASDVLNFYKGEEKRIESAVESVDIDDNTHAILCRNNSTMVEKIDELVQKEIDFKTIANPDKIFNLAISIYEFKVEKKIPNSKGLKYFKRFNDYEELSIYIEESKDQELKTADKLQKRYGAKNKETGKYSRKLYQLKTVAKQNFFRKDIKLFLCSVHMSKGLEWGKVTLEKDFKDLDEIMEEANIENSLDLMDRASMNEVTANNIVQEVNLFYVGITRAKRYLENYTKNQF